MKIYINGKEAEAKSGETILSVLKRESVEVPTLCHMEGRIPSGACRICVVEVEGQSNLIPSCSYPVAEGMRIITNSSKVINARKTIIELLLSSHPDDCLYCDKQDKCELLSLARKYGVNDKRFIKTLRNLKPDFSSPSIIRDPNKCILCGKCVRVCEEVQGVGCIDFVKRGFKSQVGCAFNSSINITSCVNCGQCINVCPTGALMENNNIKMVQKAIESGKFVVAQHAPAVSVSLGEEFGFPPGKDVDGLMVTALREIGFKAVFDTSFAADLTIMEEASELVERIKSGKKNMPMFTSCCPGWVKYVETFFPDYIPNLSTCKSPHQMLGAVIKSYYAKKNGIKPEDIVVVSIMPCTAKKFEIKRDNMSSGEVDDVDYSLTTRELARMISIYGIDFKNLKPSKADIPFGERSGAGKIFGSSGGVCEAALRTAYWLVTGKDIKKLDFESVRGLDGIKKAEVDINGIKLRIGVVSGLGNIKSLLKSPNFRDEYDFVEVMACPGGCINGGGQPFNKNRKALVERMKSLYQIDSEEKIRTSHSNQAVKFLYEDFLKKPLGEKSHHLLHTSYVKRIVADK